MTQATLDFIHHKENNASSQKILDSNAPRFADQNKTVLKHLLDARLIDGDIARDLYKIRHLPRRILSIEELTGVKPARKRATNGFTTYYFTPDQIEKVNNLLKEKNISL